MPEPTLLFQVRHPQFQELVQFRIDVENIIFKYASKTKGSQFGSTAITGSITCGWRQWKERNDDEGNLNSNIWRNDWVFCQKNHTAKTAGTPATGKYNYVGTSKTIDTSAPPPRYHPRIGFIVEFDYILHIPGHYENVRVVYGVYRNGLVVDPPRSIEWKHIKTKAFEKDRYGYAVFNSK